MTPTSHSSKSSVEEIRRRFDQDVERFSNLDTGQSATVDARIAMDLVAQTAARTTPAARHVLDIGCGAGNYSLRLLQELPGLDVTLLDLSRPMLDRAVERVSAATPGRVTPVMGDIREVELGTQQFDIVLAAAVLHHLRTDAEWDFVFTKVHEALRPGGSFWIFDLVDSASPAVQAVMRDRYSDYLIAFKGAEYRDHVFAYIEAEDSPRSVVDQLDRLRRCGFVALDVLHKNSCFAAFGGMKPAS
ncbi:ubiquinone/menaquinone biosynthesis methyltransferase [Caulifigura coniformis]|uniref:Ubiquinone/menaquinone biosynthesis methyltransferase n=1 Tax=Caulifigura coniformis TaxID=2527983 RepID=A0A517SFC0_9PLAN|nr:class I SAM-dependent methyltransferase [Caulifigura coniformis]QDT54819.1 ubiquinone/menaquinone biosynthesis methyltransferase [Caulifigura coniformis]